MERLGFSIHQYVLWKYVKDWREGDGKNITFFLGKGSKLFETYYKAKYGGEIRTDTARNEYCYREYINS
jgi:hypothetical protein